MAHPLFYARRFIVQNSPFKSGMRVSFSANPMIPVTKYWNLKPGATVSVVLDYDRPISVQENEAMDALHHALQLATVAEIRMSSEAMSILDGGENIDKLAKELLRSMGNVNTTRTIEKDASQVGDRQAAPVAKRAVARKA